MKGKFTQKLLTPFKVFAVLGLAVVSINANASVGYVGNPERPDTIWIPAHCDKGCWNEGYFLKLMNKECVNCSDMVWVEGMNDRYGNWIPAHYELKRYTVVNSRPESDYAGFAM